jgi:protein gp37
MNRTKIETCDFTWNPATGCWGPGGTAEKPNRCAYCYAWKINTRFAGGRILSGNMAGHEKHDPFAPTFHPDRLSQPSKVKKPSRIFVCSMADLFGDSVPDKWIAEVIAIAHLNRHHIFQFLTKNPKRLNEWAWPNNCWVGTTVTNQADADERIHDILAVNAPVRFVSHEPLLGQIGMPWPDITKDFMGEIQWAIIGAMTGPGAIKTETEWVMNLADQYQKAGVPMFLKDNLGFKDQPQEFPAGG